VLSGFVIEHAYRERLLARSSDAWTFLVRRIGRLWPLHVVVLFVFIALQVSVLLASWIGIDVGQRAAFGRSSVSEIPAVLFVVVVVLVARTMYLYVEVPGQRAFNRWATRIGERTRGPAPGREDPTA
jgi:peptidoglycan/LPS O-acetylase OafA/YrhL